MRFLSIVSLFAGLTLAHASQAELLTLKPGTISKKNVNISTGATASLDGKNFELTTVGSGIRTKVVVVKLPIYVTQLMVAEPAQYVKTEAGALESLEKQSSVALRLTFLRDVPADKIETSFQDGLDANGVNSKDADVAAFLQQVNKSGDATSGASITILMTRNADQTVTLAFENTSSAAGATSSITVSAKTLHQVMSIWLGTPADAGLASLKTEMMQ